MTVLSRLSSSFLLLERNRRLCVLSRSAWNGHYMQIQVTNEKTFQSIYTGCVKHERVCIRHWSTKCPLRSYRLHHNEHRLSKAVLNQDGLHKGADSRKQLRKGVQEMRPPGSGRSALSGGCALRRAPAAEHRRRSQLRRCRCSRHWVRARGTRGSGTRAEPSAAAFRPGCGSGL